MQAKETRKREKTKRPPRGASRRTKCPRYSAELKLRAVKLHVEEGFDLKLVAQEVGASDVSIREWIRRYQEYGRAGLEAPIGKTRKAAKPKLPPLVKQEIVAVKKQHPAYGVRRIAHWLRRALFLPASPETVRRTLHQHQLLPKTKPRRMKKNPPKPRFFERTTPNQMWQSDIFCFRLDGRNAYLIGFIDDHSRYIVGLGLFRSQTGENVMEVYRTAVGEHGVPKEMLTDNGRQYATWRGKTRFQQELAKDRIHHIRSTPHHPMTLGKIERFWRTIWQEFLVRAQFDSFESARERVALWVKYYNYKRTHQSLDGLVPADRYFAMQKEVRQAVEQGLQENLLELALRGQPKNPFYMVGRLGAQSVVMKVEKGQLKMVLDGEEDRPVREVVYDMEANGDEQHGEEHQEPEGPGDVQCATEVPGGAGRVDGTPAALGCLPGSERVLEPASGLAGTGDGEHAQGVRAAPAPAGGSGNDPGRPATADAGAQAEPAGQPDGTAGREAGQACAGEAADQRIERLAAGGEDDESTEVRHEGGPGGVPEGVPPGPGRNADGEGRSPAPGDLPEDLLRMGSPGVQRPDGISASESGGTPVAGPGPDVGASQGREPTSVPAGPGAGADAGNPAPAGGG